MKFIPLFLGSPTYQEGKDDYEYKEGDVGEEARGEEVRRI